MNGKVSWPVVLLAIAVIAAIGYGLFSMQQHKADAQARQVEDVMQKRLQQPATPVAPQGR